MQLNHYEIIYILKPDITENHNLDLVSKHQELIKTNGGKNILIQHRGRRHLSYNIMNYYDGIYVQMNYDGNGKLVNIVEKSLRFNDNVIRHLTIKKTFVLHPY